MQNNTGAPQPPSLMYYYVALPATGGQPPYVQGGEGMNQGGQFDAQQAFPQGNYYQEQDPNAMGGVNVGQMGHMQAAMMPAGQVPGQMMVVTTMMPQQGPQPSPNMDQPQDSGQVSGGWQNMSQQSAHDAQPPTSVSSSNQGSKAFKIYNPYTHEEVKGKSGGMVEDTSPGGAGGSGPVGGGNA
eukprot:CAMPEP_0117587250 /NCGR_PEP_ID=MMETSP0784-20121206/69190_1 /TAXON_ID=39447 /ORGANISM="" /LENGTH=183 /DNA_ID=CAMNT_0005388475 /DNA_START=122 /DNA_END=670 /DNA_ORIENTATION=+